MLVVSIYTHDKPGIKVKADKVKVNDNGDLLLQDLNDPTPHTGFACGCWEFYKTEPMVEGEESKEVEGVGGDGVVGDGDEEKDDDDVRS